MGNQENISEPEEKYLSEVEPEVENQEEQLTLMKKPFDPTLINIDTKTPSLDTLIERIRHENIELKTESYFQRNPNLWDKTKQSRLIESILIRFPLPAFYFDGSDNNNWLVVDGLQRLSSIRNFVLEKEKPLKLYNLEFLSQLENKAYDELDWDLQQLIKETQVVIYIINPGTPVDVKFNIFKRINTGGLVLESQEIRHALFQGAPAEFVAELGSLKEFETATAGSLRKNQRMVDRDLATRFLSFYLFGYQNYEGDLDTFMSKAMAAIYEFSVEKKMRIRQEFIASLNLNSEVFGGYAFRKLMPAPKLYRINKAIFEVFSVQFALLTQAEREILKKNKADVKNSYIDLLEADRTFLDAVTSSTGDKKRVMYRHSKIENLIKNIIKNQA